jgi:DNA-binding PadR family transcriptional regulator
MIQYAILGLLSWQPLSGYDLKKIISESEVFYWSGNNNQIYTALVRLHADGLATRQVQLQESLPAKKIYSITPAGSAELRRWVLSTTELSEVRNTLLIQLAWADSLSAGELDALLGRYEDEIDLKQRMLQEKASRPALAPDRTPREIYLWEQVSQYLLSACRNELDWVRRLRTDLRTEFS